jgi:hypothetical protein
MSYNNFAHDGITSFTKQVKRKTTKNYTSGQAELHLDNLIGVEEALSVVAWERHKNCPNQHTSIAPTLLLMGNSTTG